MDLHKTILFYSKYSQSSNNLLKLIDTCGINIQEILNYRLISVDSKSIRKQLLTNQNIKVNHVPCLLKIFNNGTVEQYNYKELYQLIEYTIKLHKEEQLKQQPPPIVKHQSSPVVNYPSPVVKSESSDSEIEEIPIEPKKKQKKKHRKKSNKEQGTTNILSDDEPESDSEHSIKENYTDTNKPTANKQKSDDLMSRAMEMQKERETNDDNTNTKQMPRVGPI